MRTPEKSQTTATGYGNLYATLFNAVKNDKLLLQDAPYRLQQLMQAKLHFYQQKDKGATANYHWAHYMAMLLAERKWRNNFNAFQQYTRSCFVQYNFCDMANELYDSHHAATQMYLPSTMYKMNWWFRPFATLIECTALEELHQNMHPVQQANNYKKALAIKKLRYYHYMIEKDMIKFETLSDKILNSMVA